MNENCPQEVFSNYLSALFFHAAVLVWFVSICSRDRADISFSATSKRSSLHQTLIKYTKFSSKHRLVKQVLRRLLKKKGRGELCRQYSPHKNCPYQEFFWFVFSRIRTEYGDLKSKFRIRENTNQKTPNLDDFYAVTCSAEAKKVFFFFSTLKLC